MSSLAFLSGADMPAPVLPPPMTTPPTPRRRETSTRGAAVTRAVKGSVSGGAVLSGTSGPSGSPGDISLSGRSRVSGVPHVSGVPGTAGDAAARVDAPGAAGCAAALVAEFWHRMATNDFESVGELLADDFVLDWPQSGERFRGAERFVRMNREYPAHGPWRFRVHRVVDGGPREAVSDVAVTDGVQQARVVSFFDCEPATGRVRRIVEFWPEPYPAPAWRASLAEAIDGEGDEG